MNNDDKIIVKFQVIGRHYPEGSKSEKRELRVDHIKGIRYAALLTDFSFADYERILRENPNKKLTFLPLDLAEDTIMEICDKKDWELTGRVISYHHHSEFVGAFSINGYTLIKCLELIDAKRRYSD